MVELYEVLPQPLTPAGLLLGSGTNASVSSFQPLPLEVGRSRRTHAQAWPGTYLSSSVFDRSGLVALMYCPHGNVWHCLRLPACAHVRGATSS